MKSLWPKFESIITVTGVGMIKTDGQFDLPAFYGVTKTIRLPQGNESGKKIKLPKCSVNGAIISKSYKDCCEGLILKEMDPNEITNFRNSITINMSIVDAIINIRLSPKNIHMCGVKSREQMSRVADTLFDLVHSLQDDILWCLKNMSEVDRVTDYIERECETNWEFASSGQEPILLRKWLTLRKLPDAGDKLDERIFNFVYRKLEDHSEFEVFLEQLVWILKQELCDPERKRYVPENILTISFNKNFRCPYDFSRTKLTKYINNKNGFKSNYDNLQNRYLRIKLPFILDKEMRVSRKKKKGETPKQTFIVYKNGVIIHSGPSQEMMKDVYELFIKTMDEIRPLINRGPDDSPTGTDVPGTGDSSGTRSVLYS